MSLIYQALKQTEQRSTALPATVVRQASVTPAGRGQAARWYRHPVARGLIMVAAGGLLGMGINGWLNATPAPAIGVAPSPRVPVVAPVDAAFALPRGEPAEMLLDRLPTAELPLPTVSPQLKLSLALPQAETPAASTRVAAPAVAAKPAAPAEPTGVQAAAAAVAPASSTPSPVTSAVDIKVRQPGVLTGAAASETVADLFDSLNRALASRDQTLAQGHLAAIQSRLPESSVARLRAEAWFAHQTGDADGASQLYRRLLSKLPGDEHTSLNLASVEKRRQRPDVAKEVLSRALQHNPASSGLREALSQLAQSESGR